MTVLSYTNYTTGQADLYFEASVNHASLDAGTTNGLGSQFRTNARLFGNIVTSDIAPEVTYLEHFITTTTGERQKDHIVSSTKSLMIPFTFDEINEGNFRKFMFGTDKTASMDAAGNSATPLFRVMDAVLEYGSGQLYFKTDVGNDFVYCIPKCTIRPDGNMTMSAEDWWQAPMVLEVLHNSWTPTENASNIGDCPYGIVSMTAIS